MKTGVYLCLFLLISLNLSASLIVKYNSSLDPEFINTEKISGLEYFNIYELNKAFKAVIKEDLLDQRININMYDQQLIILMDSSYLLFQNQVYNFSNPVISREGRNLLPLNFIREILPLLYHDEIQIENGSILAKTPVDFSLRTVVIDPGHGGRDPGAVGYSRKNYEKDITLSISKKLKKLLEKELGLKVVLTRDRDEFVSLQNRTQLANRVNADLFVSIHCNAHRSSKINGIEVFYLSTAKTDEDRAVEALENSVIFDFEGGDEAVQKYDDLALILMDMAQNEQLIESFELSSILQDNLVETTKSYNRGVKQANFYVLRGAYMPAVLVELGFISNKEEEKKLIKNSYQEKLALSLFNGIKSFKYKYDQMQ